MITRQQAIDLFGSAVHLAAALDYTSRHAVYMWPKTGHIPEAAFLKIRYQLKPEAFNADGSLKSSRARKQVAGNDAVHGSAASRNANAPAIAPIKGQKGEVAHG